MIVKLRHPRCALRGLDSDQRILNLERRRFAKAGVSDVRLVCAPAEKTGLDAASIDVVVDVGLPASATSQQGTGRGGDRAPLAPRRDIPAGGSPAEITTDAPTDGVRGELSEVGLQVAHA